MAEDPRLAAARYRAEQAAAELEDGSARSDESTDREIPASTPQTDPGDPPTNAGAPTASDRAAYVETAIQQAIRRGEFDDLPGAGKPIEGLGTHHDPDWWIRRKIQTEQLTGLGPPALLLRTEHAEFIERVDALGREDDVREYVEDFNRRIIDARRQLLGGPPVVTPTRDVDAEVEGWRTRRAVPLPQPSEDAPTPRRRRRLRRR